MNETSPMPPEAAPKKCFCHYGYLVVHWLIWWLLFTFSFVLIGGVLGSLIYLVVGSFTHPDLELSYRLSKGFLNGAYYFGIWAGGLGIVLCVMKAHKEGRFN